MFATSIAALFLADVERVTRGVVADVVLVFAGVVLITAVCVRAVDRQAGKAI